MLSVRETVKRGCTMDDERTSEDALADTLKAQRDLFVRGSNWDKQANHIVARNVLHAELGMYADPQPNYQLDQDTRDRLLVHARQDAAEALCHVRTLMDEVHQMKSAWRSLNFSIWVLFVAYLVWTWSQSGFALWPWLEKLFKT